MRFEAMIGKLDFPYTWYAGKHYWWPSWYFYGKRVVVGSCGSFLAYEVPELSAAPGTAPEAFHPMTEDSLYTYVPGIGKLLPFDATAYGLAIKDCLDYRRYQDAEAMVQLVLDGGGPYKPHWCDLNLDYYGKKNVLSDIRSVIGRVPESLCLDSMAAKLDTYLHRPYGGG